MLWEANPSAFNRFHILGLTAFTPCELSSRFILRIIKYFCDFADNNFVVVQFGCSCCFIESSCCHRQLEVLPSEMNCWPPKHIVRNIPERTFRPSGKRDFVIFNQNMQGLTMIEVMIVIVIIGIISSIAIPSYFSSKEKARIAATIGEIKILEKMIMTYNIDHGAYPENLDELEMGNLKDPWGNPYQYYKIEGRTIKGVGKMRKNRNMVPVNSDFDLYSKGKDSKSQTPSTAKASHDDIVRANNGRFIGLVSEY